MARNAPLRLRAGTFDLAVAGFAAVAIGFAGFALPEWRLYQLLSAVHLPDLLSAAQPPLGLKARAAAAILLGGGAFAAVFLLMRMLDRRPAARPAAAPIADAEVPIRLRRADAHPDNPARRPLVANRELGEPFDELLLETPIESGLPGSRLPTFLMPDEPAPAAAPLRTAAAETVDFVEIVAESASVAPEPVPTRLFDRVFGESNRIEVAPVAAAAVAAAPVAAASDPVPPVDPEPPLDRPVPAPSAEESISILMQRLESGLRRRESVAASPPANDVPPPSGAQAPAAPAEESISDRLRSAMVDLQRLAARG